MNFTSTKHPFQAPGTTVASGQSLSREAQLCLSTASITGSKFGRAVGCVGGSFTIASTLGMGFISTAQAVDLNVNLELPKFSTAEYHRPYVAMWLEKPDQSFAANLSVWYDLKKRDNEGTKWLKDLRQWWRRSGRELSMPIDGLSGATRTSGEHHVVFSGDKGDLSKLSTGDYVLVVEAAREGGGREVVKVPLTWSKKGGYSAKAEGSHELGKIAVTLK